MADNYLEKRYDAVFGQQRPKVRRVGRGVDELLKRNRSTRGYNPNFVVSREMLLDIVSVANKLPSARNQQVLRYRLVTRRDEAALVLQHVRMGAALPELHLPLPGTEPNAFVVVCSTVKENAMVDIDLGIAAQSLLLRAVEMGLNGLIIAAFQREALREALQLPCEPMLVIALGKSAEHIETVPIAADESHNYYRRDGIHYVPKVQLSDLLIDDTTKNNSKH